MSKKSQFWAVIPAAGSGQRMRQTLPKQYLSINGKTIAEHTVARLLSVSTIERLVVAVAEDDPYWPETEWANHPKVRSVTGGSERFESVLNGLQALSEFADADDWVLVHDIARPCIRVSDIFNLMEQLKDHSVGGLLAVPVRDTMKRGDDGEEISATVDRNQLWHALTPQMFRYGVLVSALESAVSNKQVVTDESQAVELQGGKPKLVEGCRDNMKVTFPEDLLLAKFYLRQQELEAAELLREAD